MIFHRISLITVIHLECFLDIYDLLKSFNFQLTMKSIFIACLALIPIMVFSQENWKSYFKNESVTIEYLYEECHNEQNGSHKQYVLLRISNISDKALEIKFTKEFWYDDKCTNCNSNSPEHQAILKLKPNSIDEGSCGTSNTALKIFSKFLDMKKSQLTRFELKNISVSPLN